MELTLLDHAGRKKTFDIGDIANIARITINVANGDEIANVIYKDHGTMSYESNTCGFIDYAYDIYDICHRLNLLNYQKWLNRKSSYDFDMCY